MSVTVPTKTRKLGSLQWGRVVPRGKVFCGAQGLPGGRLAVGHKANPAPRCMHASVTGDLEQTYIFIFKCLDLLTGKM